MQIPGWLAAIARKVPMGFGAAWVWTTGGGTALIGNLALESIAEQPAWFWPVWWLTLVGGVILLARGLLGLAGLAVQRGWLIGTRLRALGMPRIEVSWGPMQATIWNPRDVVHTPAIPPQLSVAGDSPAERPVPTADFLKPGSPNSLAIRPATKREAAHRLPRSLAGEPEDSPHRLDFCKQREKLVGRGLALLEELSEVPTDAAHAAQLEWQAKISRYRNVCRDHHYKWWSGVNYAPFANVGAPLAPPAWRGPDRDRITAHLAWALEYGWGCDETPGPTVTSADDTRDARDAFRDLIAQGEDFSARLRGLDLEIDDPEPIEGDVAELLWRANNWVHDAQELDAYWYPPAPGLAGMGLASAIQAMNIPVRAPVWRQRAVQAVDSQLAVLRGHAQ